MEPKDRRSTRTGVHDSEGHRAGRRAYEAPSVRAFGRRLPAFAPPSPPPPPGTRPPFSSWFDA